MLFAFVGCWVWHCGVVGLVLGFLVGSRIMWFVKMVCGCM